MSDWTDEELEASVIAYRQMERMHGEDRPYSKKAVYVELAERFPRSAGAFEYRMQNITAVLQENAEPWIPGLRPAANIGANVKPRIDSLLKKHPRHKQKRPIQAQYKAKLPAMREWLIRVARSGKTVTYRHVIEAFGIDRFSLRHAMDYLGHQAENADEPILTALVVGKHSGHCGAGFAIEFGIDDDDAERQKLFDFWQDRDVDTSAVAAESSLEVRSARFVSVEARPDQAAFRRRVFAACSGRYVISGCDVLPALDAAHKKDRNWRAGHNSASDGYVMRKDLHALYDAGLLRIEPDGTVAVDPSILASYSQFEGTKVEAGFATDKAAGKI
jgi:hypothetical protein